MSRIAEALDLSTYGGNPGFKEPTTSRDAAKAVASGTQAVRERVFQAIAVSAQGLTADEAAAIVGRKPAYCRPRCSELRAAGRIVPFGRRRNPDTGLSATVWRAA